MMRIFTFTFVLPLLMLFSLGACSPLGLLNATVSSDGYNSTLNQAYGEQVRQQLNIHVPKTVNKDADVVIFFYGGRWQSGNKEDYAFVADAYTSNGVILVIPDYRVYPQVDWRDFIRDGAAAYQWVYENIARFGGNAERIFMMGHSAGAHISAMVAVRQSLIGSATKRPCGFIGLSGPYDFLPIRDDDVKRVFASADDLQNTQPITFVSRGVPDMLLLHGRDDTTVKPGNSTRLAARVNQLNGRAQVKLYEGVDHIDILLSLLLSLASTFRRYSPALADSMVFIQDTRCQ